MKTILQARRKFWSLFLLPALITDLVGDNQSPEPVYLILGSPSEDDSCVLPLVRSEDIDDARAAIRHGESRATFKVVQIAAGNDGINRNYESSRASDWSWHIVEFLWLSNGTSRGASPATIEADPDFYLSSRANGRIALWYSYTFVHELGPRMHLTVRPAGEDLEILWAGAGPGYVYTLEFTDSLSAPDWQPLPGADWPLNVAKWTVTTSRFQDRFYRVRATLPEPENSDNSL